MPGRPHSPVHGQVCANVVEVLTGWSPTHSKGLIFANQPTVLIRMIDIGHNIWTGRDPDIVFIDKDRVPPRRSWRGMHLPVPPDLAIEVFDGLDVWEEVERMIDDCFDVGVREFWVLRLRERELRVFRPSGGSLKLSCDTQLSSDVLPGFRCKVGDFFAGV